MADFLTQAKVAGRGAEKEFGIPPVSDTSGSSDNADTAIIDAGIAKKNLNDRRGKQRERTAVETQELIESIPDGASFVLFSPKRGKRTSYFKEGGNFYLESEREGTSKAIKNDDVQKQLRNTWTLESITSPVADPVVPVVSATPDPVTPVAPVNATELQKEKKQPTEGEIEAVQKEKESYVSGEVFAEQILEERDAQKKDSVSLISQSNDTSRSSLDAVETFASQPRISEAIAQGVEVKTEDDTWATFTESVKGKKSFTLVSVDGKEALVLTRIADKWFDSKGKGVSDEGIRERLQHDWKLLDDRERSTLEAFGRTPEPTELDKIQTAISALYSVKKYPDGREVESGKLVDARKKYADAKYENERLWKKILKKLPLVKKKETDGVPEEKVYSQLRRDLIDLEVAKLRLMESQGQLTPEQREAEETKVKQLIRTETTIKVLDAYKGATSERTSWAKSAFGAFEDIGKWYNKQPLWAKVGVGVALMGGAVLTGGGVAGVAIPMMVRRALGTAGMYASLDPMAEKYFREKLEKRILEDSQKSVEMIQTVGDRMDVLKLMLQKDSDNLDQNLTQGIRGNIFRKASVFVFSGAVGFGSALFSNVSEAAGVKDAAKGAASATKAAAENVGQVPAPGSGTIAREQLAKALQGGVDGKPDVPPISPSVAEAVKNAVGVPSGVGDNIYEVSKGDTVDGLIGSYLSEHYQNFDGMTDGQKTHAINALERQLKHLSPEQLKLAGIGSGNIHSIQLEEHIDLDKLFSTADADKVMGKAANISAVAQQSIEANNEKIAEWVKTHPGEPYLGQSLEATPSHVAPASHVMNTRGTMQLPPSSGAGVPSDYIPDASDAAMDQAKQEISKLQNNVASAQESINALAMQPRVDGWIKPMLESVPEGSPVSSISMAEMKKIPLKDIQYAMTHDSADAYERVHMTREQFANVKQFIQGAEKDRLVPPLNDIVGRKPDLKIGDYITKIALDPKVKIGYMVGGRGGFSTSI